MQHHCPICPICETEYATRGRISDLCPACGERALLRLRGTQLRLVVCGTYRGGTTWFANILRVLYDPSSGHERVFAFGGIQRQKNVACDVSGGAAKYLDLLALLEIPVVHLTRGPRETCGSITRHLSWRAHEATRYYERTHRQLLDYPTVSRVKLEDPWPGVRALGEYLGREWREKDFKKADGLAPRGASTPRKLEWDDLPPSTHRLARELGYTTPGDDS